MSAIGRSVVKYIDDAERQILARRERAFLKSETARTARQHRRANKRVRRAFGVSSS